MNHTIKLLFYALFLVLQPLFSVGDSPAALYLTWQRDPTTSMTVQWITTLEDLSDRVYYRLLEGGPLQMMEGSHIQMPGQAPYLIHRAELTSLDPNSAYVFKMSLFGSEYKFRTLPSRLDSPLRFIVGGDLYQDNLRAFATMSRQAAKRSPAFVLFGGDLAYAADRTNFLSYLQLRTLNYTRWIEWLSACQQELVTPDGFLIPLIVAIGNHDVEGGTGKTAASAPMFYALFPSSELTGCYALDIGNYLSIFLLDSGLTHPIAGTQTAWLDQALSERADTPHKFALYHIGAYPSARSQNQPISCDIRAHWVPLFEKYGLSAAFENHDHAYKRTHLLKGGKVDPAGVLYIGDGAWGITKPRTPRKPKSTWYLAKSQSVQHAVLVVLTSEKRHYLAIDSSGAVIDDFVQTVNE